MSNEKTTIPNVPKSVTVSGVQVPVNVTGTPKKPVITTEPADPRKAIKTSPYSELLPANDEWVNKYGGSDNSIVAFNVAEILKLINPEVIKENTSEAPDENQASGQNHE